jgi:predicted enzyme related to lactoylglutathione lyase
MSNGTRSFTKVVVVDLDTEVAVYHDVFGFVEGHRIKGGLQGASFEEVFFTRAEGPPVLGLVMYVDWQPAPVGESVIGFSTPDIAAVFKRARRHGGTVRREPTNSEESHGFTVGLLEDPEGYLIEVVEVTP